MNVRPRHILLVEDNPYDAELTKRAFSKSQIADEMIVAKDGETALDYMFGTGAYDGRDPSDLPVLILLDLHLPKIQGLEVLRKVRTNEQTHRVPVVILTTSRDQEDIAASYDLGVNSYVCKPVDFLQLAKTTEHLGLYWLAINEPPPRAL